MSYSSMACMNVNPPGHATVLDELIGCSSCSGLAGRSAAHVRVNQHPCGMAVAGEPLGQSEAS